MNTFIFFIALLIFIELFLQFYLRFLRNSFQWLIIKDFDLNIKFKKKDIDKFRKNSYDKSLGWVTKSNLIKIDKVKSFGEKSNLKFKKVKYTQNNNGERYNPNYEGKLKKIFTFGDSFVFNRHVNDNDTWQHRLSKYLNQNVVNYGVGNYGVDQSILRMNNVMKKKKNKIVLLGFVPETIVRVHSSWRHFYEYGNIFAFKPRYTLKNAKLNLIKNPLSDLKNLKNIKKKINSLKKKDYWYKKKFEKDLIRFPFLLSIFKKFPKNLLIIFFLTLDKFFLSNYFYNLAWKIVLKSNFKNVIESYSNKNMVKLLVKEIEFFTKKVKQMNCKPAVIIFPYNEDVNYIKKNNYFYKNFVNQIESFVHVIDLSSEMLRKKNRNNLYVNSYYGAHLSKQGNEFCAKKIHYYLKKHRLSS